MQVLLPSDDEAWMPNFAEGYRKLGFEVVVGALNFELEACVPDVLHLNWPEELTQWKCPTPSELAEYLARLERWSRRAWIIVTVNNLYPHLDGARDRWRELYLGTYEKADVIHHFSHVSHKLVCNEFPEIADRNHVVQLGFNYERILSGSGGDRDRRRSELGFSPDDTVFLSFGSLRSWDEVKLLRDAFESAKIPGKKMLMAGRYHSSGPVWRQRAQRSALYLWTRGRNVVSIPGVTPEKKIPELFAAADILVVVRKDGLSSGLPSLGMTLGKPVIAPAVGAIPEYLSGSYNVLYDPASSQNLAAAMEHIAKADRAAIGRTNREIASGWRWDTALAKCLSALPAGYHASGIRPKMLAAS